MIDICIVKYTPNKESLDQYNKLIKQLPDKFNILIHDNNENNIGLIKARNILLSKSSNKYVCFADFDIDIINIEWEDIIEKFEATENLAIVSPVSKGFSTVDRNVRWQPKQYLACNFMIFNRHTFDIIGQFDEEFFVAYGDWDIIKRCINNNLLILQDNNSVIKHYGLSRMNPNKNKMWNRDFKMYISKHVYPLNRSLK